MTDLMTSAYDLAEEIWAGKWSHIIELKLKPAPDCEEIIEELCNRSPGYTLEQYKRAIA